jgi:hypothetical protein
MAAQTFRNAIPRSPAQLVNRSTLYEVVAVHPTHGEFVVGFTARKSRDGLFSLLRTNATELRNLPALRVESVFTFQKIGASFVAHADGWLFRFSGRTERQAYGEGR